MFCRTTHVFCNQLVNYLLTSYPVRPENTKPSVTSRGRHFVRSVLCHFGLSIFQYGPGDQLIDRYYLPKLVTLCIFAFPDRAKPALGSTMRDKATIKRLQMYGSGKAKRYQWNFQILHY